MFLHSSYWSPLRSSLFPYTTLFRSYGWRRFMEEGAGDEDAEWLSRLPMTRAVVQAMDIVTEYTRLKTGPEIENFVVSGASKREIGRASCRARGSMGVGEGG